MADVKTMNRITPEEVVKAYQVSGLFPIRGVWIDDAGNCGCGLTACVLQRGIRGPDDEYLHNPTFDAADELGLEYGYGSGFVSGFDGDVATPLPVGFANSDEYKIGLADGLAAAAAVFGPLTAASEDEV